MDAFSAQSSSPLSLLATQCRCRGGALGRSVDGRVLGPPEWPIRSIADIEQPLARTTGTSARPRRSDCMRRLTPIAILILAACSPEPVGVKTGDAEPVAVFEGMPTAEPATAQALSPDQGVAEQPKLAVDSEGLRWVVPPDGPARPLAFGTPKADVVGALESVRGPAGKGVNQDCGAGPVQYANWSDGLSLVFQNGEFAGWGLDRRASGALATADGVGPGMTRSALADSSGSVTYRDTSLGVEFAAGEIFGVLDGSGSEAKITDMWAGVNCIAR